MASIEVEGKVFKSKQALKDRCKVILNSGELGAALTGTDSELIEGVLKLHPNYKKKVGKSSYKIVRVMSELNLHNRMFYIKRKGGGGTDFSYLKCISYPSRSSLVKKALRTAVYPQASSYKRKYFSDHKDSKGYVICPATGLKVSWKDSHLDHYPKQFNQIVLDWAEILEVDLSAIDIEAAGDDTYDWIISDGELEESFCYYHQEVATYRVVLDKVNQQRSKTCKGEINENN